MEKTTNINKNKYLYTRERKLPLFSENSRNKRDEQREISYKGKELPERIREILDETPTFDLKDDIKRFKKHVPKYNHDEWTRTSQINKEFTNELKKWKVDTFQVVTSIIKHAEEARIQARTSTEIFELLESIEEKCRFEDEGAHQTFLDAMAQASKSAVFGFAHAKELDHEAKDYSAKALRLPASLRHVEQEDGRKPNLFDSEFVKELHEARFSQRVIAGVTNYYGRGRGFSHGSNGRGSRPFNRYQSGNFQPRGRGCGTFGASTTKQHSTHSYTDKTADQQ